MRQTIFDQLLAILCSVLDAYSAVLVLPDRSRYRQKEPQFLIESSFSLGNKVDDSCVLSEGKGLVGWILRHHEPLLVANFDQRQNKLGYYLDDEEQNIKAFMGTSLEDGCGALCVDSKRQYSFSEKDQKMLYLFAELITDLLREISADNKNKLVVRYYNGLRTIYALRHRFSRWSEFLQHFLDLMATMTGFTYCAFCTRDAMGENYILEGENTKLLLNGSAEPPAFPIGQGITGWVFKNGTPIICDAAEGKPDAPLLGNGLDLPPFQTLLAFPLVIHRKARGVLCLAHDTSLLVDPATKEFVGMAAEHLALFLENLYVKSKLRDLHNRVNS